MDINASTLASFVFIDNINDVRIDLTLPTLKTSYDLFCFFLNLVMQGILFYCGNGIEVDDIPIETIQKIIDKLKNMSVLLHVTIQPKVGDQTCVSIMSKDKVYTISDYALFIHSKDKTYTLTFSFLFNHIKN